MVDFARHKHGLSVRSACHTLRLSRTVYHYKPNTSRDEPVIKTLQELADRYPRYGFGKMFPILRRHGHRWNHKRVYRVYCALGLNMRRKGKRRLPNRNPERLTVPDSGGSSSLSSRASLRRTRSSNGSTELTGTRFWICICSRGCRKYGRSPRIGSRNITLSGLTTHSVS